MTPPDRTAPWTHDGPTTPGWYATLVCWDQVEGWFPGSHEWTGTGWANPDREPIECRSPEPFPTSADAEAWANENDPLW